MTKLPKPALALPSVEAAERAVAAAEDALARIEGDIASAEAGLEDLAAQDDDEAYEAASLSIERLRRSELRATKRLEAAKADLVEAEKREEQTRRRDLYAAGQKAAAEAEKLAGIYAEHAAKIAETLREIEKQRPAIDAANAARPDGEPRIDANFALRIYADVELPPGTNGGDKFWYGADRDGYSPHLPRPLKFSNAVEALPSAQTTPVPPPKAAARSAQISNNFGELRPDGVRVYKMPPCEWPPRPEPKPAQRTEDGRKIITPISGY